MYSEHKCVIEKTIGIKDESIRNVDGDFSFIDVNCFFKLRDNKTILCGCDKVFCFYDMKTEQCTITQNNHHRTINDILFKDDNTFLSCSTDTTIKVWRY